MARAAGLESDAKIAVVTGGNRAVKASLLRNGYQISDADADGNVFHVCVSEGARKRGRGRGRGRARDREGDWGRGRGREGEGIWEGEREHARASA